MRAGVWARRLEEEPGPPDEGRAGQDPPRGDWHLKTRARPNGHVLLTVAVSVPHDGLTCPHRDAGRASGSPGLHLLTGGLKFPLSLQQHLDLKTNRNQIVFTGTISELGSQSQPEV